MNLSQKCDTWEWRGRNECESSIMSCALPTFPPSANTTSVIGNRLLCFKQTVLLKLHCREVTPRKKKPARSIMHGPWRGCFGCFDHTQYSLSITQPHNIKLTGRSALWDLCLFWVLQASSLAVYNDIWFHTNISAQKRLGNAWAC